MKSVNRAVTMMQIAKNHELLNFARSNLPQEDFARLYHSRRKLFLFQIAPCIVTVLILIAVLIFVPSEEVPNGTADTKTTIVAFIGVFFIPVFIICIVLSQFVIGQLWHDYVKWYKKGSSMEELYQILHPEEAASHRIAAVDLMGEQGLFKITSIAKSKARKRRQRKEKKWLPLRILSWVSIGVFAASAVLGILFLPSADREVFLLCLILAAAALAGFVAAKTILTKLSSRCIQDRLNERLYVQNGILYHCVQEKRRAVLNFRPAEPNEWIYAYHLSRIRDPKYDPASGRMEFYAYGKADACKCGFQTIPDATRYFNRKPVVFYEYMEPSLYQYLENLGIKFTLETLDSKGRDPHN